MAEEANIEGIFKENEIEKQCLNNNVDPGLLLVCLELSILLFLIVLYLLIFNDFGRYWPTSVRS